MLHFGLSASALFTRESITQDRLEAAGQFDAGETGCLLG
jgi:hypothetical protein